MIQTKISSLFEIKYPIIQAGMVWCSGWRLASAVSNSGGLGLIGAGSMTPDVLKLHIKKCQFATPYPFGVNVPLLYSHAEEIMHTIVDNDVKIVFTSAGNPATWTQWLKDKGIKVIHVVSSSKFAEKAEKCGVDAVVAEGFEAGGHNGKEETTTMCLIPMVIDSIKIPVIAAGGIASGKAMLAAFALGASGVQIGSRFATSDESSAHLHFKNAILGAGEGDTELMMKELTPVRLLKNQFYSEIKKAELNGANISQLKNILGSGRAKLGMFDGNLEQGELEIGQCAAQITKSENVSDIIIDIIRGYELQKGFISNF